MWFILVEALLKDTHSLSDMIDGSKAMSNCASSSSDGSSSSDVTTGGAQQPPIKGKGGKKGTKGGGGGSKGTHTCTHCGSSCSVVETFVCKFFFFIRKNN